MCPVNQFLTGKGVNPGFVCTAPSAEFGNNYETMRIRMERPLNDLIGHVRAVVVASIDMIHAGIDRLPQNSNGGFNIPRWSKDLGASKLHCAVAHSVHAARRSRQHKGAGEIYFMSHFIPHCVPSSFVLVRRVKAPCLSSSRLAPECAVRCFDRAYIPASHLA